MNKRRILVVDDDPNICLLVKLTLEETGWYDVQEETHATRALQVARQFKPDLLLLDVMMPDLDGGDVAAMFKDDPYLKNTPVVFITAAVLPTEASGKGGMIGGHPFISKPIAAGTLVEVIRLNLKE